MNTVTANINIPTRTCFRCGWTTTETRYMRYYVSGNQTLYECKDDAACSRRRQAARKHQA